jgi:hypothetical protein
MGMAATSTCHKALLETSREVMKLAVLKVGLTGDNVMRTVRPKAPSCTYTRPPYSVRSRA